MQHFEVLLVSVCDALEEHLYNDNLEAAEQLDSAFRASVTFPDINDQNRELFERLEQLNFEVYERKQDNEVQLENLKKALKESDELLEETRKFLVSHKCDGSMSIFNLAGKIAGTRRKNKDYL